MNKDNNLVYKLRRIEKLYKNKIAIITAKKNVSYEELYDLAYVYMDYLRDKISANGIVCVICERSIELCACVLGIVQAGGAYCLYEPDDLNEEVVQNIVNINPDLIISNREIPQIKSNVVLMNKIVERTFVDREPTIDRKNNLLYIVNTSGTSSKSKAVAVNDINFLCYINGYIDAISICDKDIVLQQSPIYYDGFAEEIFSMLLVGGSIVLAETYKLRNPYMLVQILNQYRVTLLPSTPLMLEQINRLNQSLPLKKIVSSGDVLRKAQINNLLGSYDVYNMYGLTETTVCATYYKCSEEDEELIPIGKEIKGYYVILMNQEGEMVNEGEIVVGGESVAGYLWEKDNDEKMLSICGKKFFKTGDYGWKDENGQLHYIGRKDRQIKIRGNRVNLEQIESSIRENAEIDNVVVVYHKETNSLCCFFVSSKLSDYNLKIICKSKLPVYMRPNRYYKIKQIYVSDTGKIDYHKFYSLLNEEYDKVCRNVKDITSDDLLGNIIKIIRYTINNFEAKLEDTWEELGVDSLSYIKVLVAIEEEYLLDFSDIVLIQNPSSSLSSFCKNIIDYINGEDISISDGEFLV